MGEREREREKISVEAGSAFPERSFWRQSPMLDSVSIVTCSSHLVIVHSLAAQMNNCWKRTCTPCEFSQNGKGILARPINDYCNNRSYSYNQRRYMGNLWSLRKAIRMQNGVIFLCRMRMTSSYTVSFTRRKRVTCNRFTMQKFTLWRSLKK